MFNALSNNEVAIRYANTRCQEAREEVLRRYHDLVHSCVKEYRGRYDIEDIVQEARIALVQALEKYQPTQGMFSTIAVHYIKGKVNHYLRDKGYLVRVPAWVQDHYRREQVCRLAFEAATGREPVNEELAPLMGMTVEKLNHIHTYNPRYIRLQSIDCYTTGFTSADGDRKALHHPESMKGEIDGKRAGADVIDLDEVIAVRETSADQLSVALGISMMEARRLKESVV